LPGDGVNGYRNVLKPVWGKLLGTVAGLATGKPLLALVGLVLGHQFDRGFADRIASDRESIDDRTLRHVPEYFTRALFQIMGHVAKSDGRVSEDEIRAARSLMSRLQMSPAQARQAISWFESGKEPSFPLLATLRQFRRDSAGNADLAGLLIRLLLEVSLSKPRLGQRERSVLWAICTELDVSRVELAQLEALMRARRGFGKTNGATRVAGSIGEAYSVLGISSEASNDEIKTAYRRLMSRHHPDKIAASNPEPAEMAAAERRTRDIRSAYALLKVHRSIR